MLVIGLILVAVAIVLALFERAERRGPYNPGGIFGEYGTPESDALGHISNWLLTVGVLLTLFGAVI
jgi:hypothetical protein